MTAKYTSLIWSADLDRPLKFVALALADSADAYGIVPLDDKKMYAWLTDYTVPELDKVIAKLIKAGILVQMPEHRLRFSADPITQLTPYWKDTTPATDAETIAQLSYQLSSLHISPELVEEILLNHTAELINTWLELYEQAVEVGLADGSGYLVSALKRNWNIEDAKERIAAKRRQLAKQSPDLPDELMDLLQSLDWQDDLSEISVYYNEDSDRTLAWAVHAKKQGWEAGRFRKSLRSKLYPPNHKTHETVLMPPIFTIVNSAESSIQDDWPEPSEEAVNAWQECLKQIARMPDAERGFNGGEFASWLKPAQPIRIECTGLDNVFTVRSCNKTAAQWIAENARGTVEDVLQSVLDRSISLESVS
jgi:hypothetical protein